MSTQSDVVVLGGGFASLESAFLLNHLMKGGVNLTLVADQPDFVFRPTLVYVPFGTDPASATLPITECVAPAAINLIEDRAVTVDPVAHTVTLQGGAVLRYDKLIVGTGALCTDGGIPGLSAHGVGIHSIADLLTLRERFSDVVHKGRGGEVSRVLFVLPVGNLCPSVLYELLLMLEVHLDRHNARDTIELTLATPEGSVLEVYGEKVHELLSERLFRRDVRVFLGETLTHVEAGVAHFATGRTLHFDHLVYAPVHAGRGGLGSLPVDAQGFLQTEGGSRRVLGQPDIYAPGDGGDFPLKEPFLAFLEADAVAEIIQAELTQRPTRAAFDPLFVGVLEAFDKGIFIAAPLRLTGHPERPLEIDHGRIEAYRVGQGTLWRHGKKLLATMLPMRFRAGEPFHAGTTWKLLDVGLESMASVLAS